MSVQTDALRELVELFNARKAIDVARFFTEDFRLEDPGAGVIRTGLDGAQRMMEAVRALAHEGHLEILDMFESGNRVAARWSYKGPGASFAMLSIYEFKGSVSSEIGGSWRGPHGLTKTRSAVAQGEETGCHSLRCTSRHMAQA